MGALWSNHRDFNLGRRDILSGNSSMILAQSLTVVKLRESPKFDGRKEMLLSFADRAVKLIMFARQRGSATNLLWLKDKVWHVILLKVSGILLRSLQSATTRSNLVRFPNVRGSVWSRFVAISRCLK